MTTVVQMKPRPEPGTFEEFWMAYPKPGRVKKALTMKLWNEIILPEGCTTKVLVSKDHYEYLHLQATPEEIIAGAKAYELAIRKPGTYGEYKTEFIPHARTWLNAGLWMDHL